MMKWRNPWGSDNSWINANSPNYIDITASAKVIGADGQALPEIVFDNLNLNFWPAIADINWKQAAEIRMTVAVEYNFDSPGSGSGQYKADQAWRVFYGDNGISLEAKPSDNQSSHGTGDFAVNLQLLPDQSNHEVGPTYVSLVLRLTGGYADDGISVGFGLNTPVGGRVGRSWGKSRGNYAQDFELKILLHVRGIPDAPRKPDAPPTPPAPIDIPGNLLTCTVYFDQEMGAGKPRGEEAPYLSVTQLDIR
jgi:hypothetical protein